MDKNTRIRKQIFDKKYTTYAGDHDVNVYFRLFPMEDQRQSMNNNNNKEAEMASSPESGESSQTDVEESLLSTEKIDRSSPELWPEQRIRKFMQPSVSPSVLSQPWTGPLSEEDAARVHYYSTLSKTELIAEVKKLHDLAYQLGLEESKEMTRGKYLQVLEKRAPF